MGALSFLMVQVFRFAIAGELPNAEGAEKSKVLFNHNTREVFLLFGAGVICALVAWLMLVLGNRYSIFEEEDEEEVATARSRRELLTLRANSQMIREVFGQSASRGWETGIVFLSMCFA